MSDAVLRASAGTPAEHSAIAEIYHLSGEHDGLDPHSVLEPPPSAADIENRAAALDDPERDQRVVDIGGRIVGHVDLISWTEEDGTRLFLHRGVLRPEYRARGIGSDMLGWGECRARELGCAGRDEFGANAAKSEFAATALILDHGYRAAIRLGEFELVTDIPAPLDPPPGIDLRPATNEQEYAALWYLIEDVYRDRAGLAVGTEEGRRRFVERGPSMTWLIARDGADIIGCGGFAVAPDDTGRSTGRVLELSVRPSHRRRGLGRALLLHCLRLMSDQQPAAVRLWTNLDGPQRAYDLYRSVGFELVTEFIRYRKPMNQAAR